MQKNISKVTILQNPQSMNRKIRLQLHKISSDSNCILAIDQGDYARGSKVLVMSYYGILSYLKAYLLAV